MLNRSCQFKIPVHMLNRNRSAHDITVVYNVTDKEPFGNVKAWMGEIDKHVSDGVKKLLVENQRDLTSKEELSADEAKELADSLKRAIRVKVPRRSMSRQSCPRSRTSRKWMSLRAVVREGAVPRLTEIERQRKRHRSRRSAGTRQHFTTKPPATHTTTCTTTPPSATTYVRAGALVLPPPCLVEVSHGWVNTHSTPVPLRGNAVGSSSQCDRRQPRRDNRRAQESSGNGEIPQGTGALLRPIHILKPCPSDVNESVAYSEEHPELKFDGNNSKRAVVSSFKNLVSWLKSLCIKGR